MATKPILLILLLAIATTSCRKKACETVGIKGVELSTENNKMNDTLLIVKRYTKGNDFIKPVDSFAAPKGIAVIFDSSVKGADNFNYDYLCKLQPSGKEIRITNVDHANAFSEKAGFSCVNDIHYELNGKPKEQKGYFTMRGYIIDLSY